MTGDAPHTEPAPEPDRGREGMPPSSHAPLDFEALTRQFARTLIYVVGNARGGSTFGNAAIGIHPKLMEVRWNDKTFSSFWPNRDSASPEELWQMLLRPPDYYNRERALSRIGEANVSRLEDHVAEICRDRDLGRVFCLQGILFWIMRSDLHAPDALAGWCVKANTWQGVDPIKAALPEARVVFIERDPRSTALSLAKVHARVRETQFEDADVVQGALDWLRNATEFSRLLGRHRARATCMRYEDLVMDPIATLNRVYGFLGIDPLDEATIASALSGIFYKTTQAYTDKAPEDRVKKKGVQTEGLDRWRRELSAEQLGIVTALTGAAARRFGYALDPNGGTGGAIGAIWRAGKADRLRHLARYAYCRARAGMASGIGVP